MFCNIVFWVVASELINFEIYYPYIYRFGISCNTWSFPRKDNNSKPPTGENGVPSELNN